MTDVKPTIESVPGFKVAGVHCGLKDSDALDFALIYSDRPCVAAGVFTTNQVKAAPVLVDQERLQKNPTSIRAVAINTKCANACTGQQGIDNALQTARWVSERLGCSEDEVLVMSTGVIGTQLPMDKIRRGVDLAVDALGDNNWEDAARAIMTTDTRPKMASTTLSTLEGKTSQVAGIAKGAGMIAPNMATLLGLIVTDAGITREKLYESLTSAVDFTFNSIVVDGDMSTNDTILMLANGASGTVFEEGFYSGWLCHRLAKDIVQDAEGATKLIRINVYGTSDHKSAKQIANAIATSPLVKTAFYGGDANWGRIIAAVGRSGISVEPEQMALWLKPGDGSSPSEGLLLFLDGMPEPYDEMRASEIMKLENITISLVCGSGEGQATVLTCDLSHDYVSINGHYRT
jgi:glutamate N-acetyltransferase/amino-acid N-acetyltransferase